MGGGGGGLISGGLRWSTFVFRWRAQSITQKFERFPVLSVTWSNHCVLESSRSLSNRGNFMIYFCLMASLLNAIL